MDLLLTVKILVLIPGLFLLLVGVVFLVMKIKDII